jgi:hypothetical protein
MQALHLYHINYMALTMLFDTAQVTGLFDRQEWSGDIFEESNKYRKNSPHLLKFKKAKLWNYYFMSRASDR